MLDDAEVVAPARTHLWEGEGRSEGGESVQAVGDRRCWRIVQQEL